MEPQDAVVYRIIELSLKQHMSVHQLANRSAVPPSTLKNIINGTSKNPGIVTITKLCFGLNVTLREFFGTAYMDEVEADIED